VTDRSDEPSFFSRPIVLWLMAASIGFYAGDGYGWMMGASAAVIYLVVVTVGNVTVLKMS
jgi:hypothetical protein